MSAYRHFALFGYDNSGRGLWKSTDGASWEACAAINPATGLLFCGAVTNWPTVIGIPKTTNGTVTALFLVYGNKLWRSLDDGATFEDVSPAGAGNITGACCNPSRDGHICAWGTTKPAACTNALDTSMTWTLGTDPVPGTDTANLYWNRHGRLYYWGTNGVYLSGDGLLWKHIRYKALAAGSGFQGLFFQDYDSAEDAPCWVRTDTGLYRCIMDGDKWTGLLEGESGGDPATSLEPTGTPTNFKPSGLTAIYGVAFTPTKMLCCGVTGSTGIYHTPIASATTGTPTWTGATVDAGVDFAHLYVDPVTRTAVYASVHQTLIGAKGGVWKSADSGVTFTLSNTGITTSYVGSTQQRDIVGLIIPQSQYNWTTPSVPATATEKFSMCFDVVGKAWHYWEQDDVGGHYWDPVDKIMRAWGPVSAGTVHTRGGAVAPEIHCALMGYTNADRIKRLRHVEVDMTCDSASWECEFVVDGVGVDPHVTKVAPVRGWRVYGSQTLSWEVPTADVNTTTERVTITSHGLLDGRALVYSAEGGLSIVAETSDGAPSFNLDGYTVYVYQKTTHDFKLCLGADGTRVLNLSGTGNDKQTFTAVDSTGNVCVYNQTGTLGTYGPPRRITLRFPCPVGGRGRVQGFILRSTGMTGFLRLHAITPNTSEV